MASEKPDVAGKPVHEDRLASEYLANERTFLAWIRTSIAIVSLGFVIARFRIWMQEMGSHSPELVAPDRLRGSAVVGIGMISFGAVIALLAAWRYHVVNRQIEVGKVIADRGLIILVTVLVAVLAGVMIATVR